MISDHISALSATLEELSAGRHWAASYGEANALLRWEFTDGGFAPIVLDVRQASGDRSGPADGGTVTVRLRASAINGFMSGRRPWLYLIARGEATILGPTDSVIRTIAAFPAIFAGYSIITNAPVRPDCAFFRGLNVLTVLGVIRDLPSLITEAGSDQALVIATGLLTLPREGVSQWLQIFHDRVRRGQLSGATVDHIDRWTYAIAQSALQQLHNRSLERNTEWPLAE